MIQNLIMSCHPHIFYKSGDWTMEFLTIENLHQLIIAEL